MATQIWIELPKQGSGSGTITDINGATGPSISILPGAGIDVTTVGNDITITNIGSGQTGSPNTFAGFDGAGNLESIPGFEIDTVTGGMNVNLNNSPDDAADGQTTNTLTTNITPLQDSPNDNRDNLGLFMNMDNGNSGFNAGNATNLNIGINAVQTGSTGGLTDISLYNNLGNGTDPITVKGMGYVFSFGDINDNVTMDGQIQGYVFQPHVHSAAILTTNAGLVAHADYANIDGTSQGHVSFQASPTINEIFTNRNYEGLNINPTITTLNGNAGTSGVGVFGNITTMSPSGNFNGLVVSPNITTSHGYVGGVNVTPNITGGDAQFQGVSIAPRGGATLNNPTGININMNQIVSNDPSGMTGISSDARIQVNAETTLNSGLTFQIGSRLDHQFHVPSGSPVTGTDSIALNVAGDLWAEDDIALGPIGLGVSSVGFISSVAIDAAATVDTFNVFLAALALPDPGVPTGGNIVTVNMVRVAGPFSQGGTVNITNLYGVHVDSVFGTLASAATNAYGLYIDAGDVENWISGNTKIGGTSFSAPTASVHLPGVTTSAGSAPLKIDSGTLMTAPETGAVESDGTNLWWTDDAGARQQLNNSAGTAANTALSNLASVAINTSLLPGTGGSINLGSAAKSFLKTFTSILTNTSSQDVIDLSALTLQGAGGTSDPSIDWGNRNLINTAGGLVIDWSGANRLKLIKHLQSAQVATTTVAAQAAAGTGATSSLSNATDVAGKLELVTGTITLSTGPQVIVSFGTAYTTAPTVVITPQNVTAAQAAVAAYVTSSTSGFTINFAVASVGSQTFDWFYHVIETQ